MATVTEQQRAEIVRRAAAGAPERVAWDERLCDDCGLPLEGHPPLPPALPWSHGRPCALTSLERGRGWDGRPLPAHTDRETRRWTSREQRVPA